MKIFKPSWIVIEVYHERYTFNVNYNYCRHKNLEELFDLYDIEPELLKQEKNGNYIYDNCYQSYEGQYMCYDKFLETNVELTSHHIEFTIIIPYKNRKKDSYFIPDLTHNKFGLFDRKIIKSK